MAKRGVATIIGLTAAVAMLVAQPAAASTEVGNRCIGNVAEPNLTLISLANAPGSPLPATVPSAGVITRWSFNVEPIPPGVLSQTLRVFRPTGVPKQFQVVGESSPGAMVTGLNTFLTRLPVQAGDHLGYFGTPETVYCEKTGNPGDVIGFVLGNATTGSTATVLEEEGTLQLPLVAIVEPDVDNDGFGDETQDKCPQSAAIQAECPVVTLDTTALVRKGSVVLLVSASSQAPVTVSGKVKLPKASKPKQQARISAQAKLRKVTKTVTPGKITRFTLKFPKALKSALAQLPRSRSLTLRIEATAKDLVGRITKDRARVKLKGRA